MGKHQFCLAETTGMESHVAAQRVADMVFEACAEQEITDRDSLPFRSSANGWSGYETARRGKSRRFPALFQRKHCLEDKFTDGNL